MFEPVEKDVECTSGEISIGCLVFVSDGQVDDLLPREQLRVDSRVWPNKQKQFTLLKSATILRLGVVQELSSTVS